MKGVLALCCSVSAAAAQGVGDYAETCMDRGAAAGPCFGEETAMWEVRVAAAMDALLSAGSMEDRNSGGLEPFSQMRPRLARAAEAFEAYRADLCDFVSAGWPGTSDAGVAWAECRMRVTAAHAFQLERVLDAFE